MIILVLLVLMFLCHVIFDVPWYALILALVGFFVIAIAFIIIEAKVNEKIADSIAKAELIKEVDVYKKIHEYSGCSYGEDGRRNHYNYKKVLDHTKCTFLVKYKDGRSGSITCKKDGSLYSSLISKH